MADTGSAFAISAPSIFDGAQFLHDHCAIIEAGAVTGLLPVSQCPAGIETVSLASGTLAPGFIDLQVNGGGDVLFNNSPTPATLATMVRAHRATGTTAMMPTLISDSRQRQQMAVDAVRAARASADSGVLGIHLEGPFFALPRRGVHSASMIRPAQAGDIDWLCSLDDLAVIATVAPERMQPGQIRSLADSGVHVCAGHTDASCEQIAAATMEGLEGATHLFNAMSPLAARAPGTVGAVLVEDRLWAGIIADGHHVHPAAIRLAQRTKPPGRLVLVTDAMATVGGSQQAFTLYDEQIHLDGGRLRNREGALAGSAIGMIDAVRYASREVGIPLAECLRMASLYPAAILGLDHRMGRIATGFRADLVHFDDQFAVRNTWLGGARVQH